MRHKWLTLAGLFVVTALYALSLYWLVSWIDWTGEPERVCELPACYDSELEWPDERCCSAF